MGRISDVRMILTKMRADLIERRDIIYKKSTEFINYLQNRYYLLFFGIENPQNTIYELEQYKANITGKLIWK